MRMDENANSRKSFVINSAGRHESEPQVESLVRRKSPETQFEK